MKARVGSIIVPLTADYRVCRSAVVETIYPLRYAKDRSAFAAAPDFWTAG
jgi:hypothetical protein